MTPPLVRTITFFIKQRFERLSFLVILFSLITPSFAQDQRDPIRNPETIKKLKQQIGDIREHIHPHWYLEDEPKTDNVLAPQFYAVLINGGCTSDTNIFRFWNNLSYLYTTLRKLGISRDHITVLNADGQFRFPDMEYDAIYTNGGAYASVSGGLAIQSPTLFSESIYISSPLDLDGDGLRDIELSATPENIRSVFQQHFGLRPNDTLFVFVTGHGWKNSGSICVWPYESITPAEFSGFVQPIAAKKVFWFQTCGGGHMIEALLDERTVAMTAAGKNRKSFACDSECDEVGSYDEMAYYGIAALRGLTPEGVAVNADQNDDGLISINEVFRFSKTHNSWRDEEGALLENPQLLEGSPGLRHQTFAYASHTWLAQRGLEHIEEYTSSAGFRSTSFITDGLNNMQFLFDEQ